MALSDYEQRVLAEIEHGLLVDDPRFAESLGRRRMAVSLAIWTVGICLSLGCVLLGLVIADGIGLAVALLGFVVVVASCGAALRSHRKRRRRPRTT